MDSNFDISDSTDWLDTPLSSLARLDSALRCQVCKDFFDNPVMTSCCHTFCSLCIRRCLSAEGKCPTCRAPDQELKLRRNWAIQECVDSFRESRSGALEFARRQRDNDVGADRERDSEGPVSKKRKIDTTESVPSEESIGRRTRSQSRKTESNAAPVQAVEVDDIEDEDHQPDDGLVACPICGRRMKNEAVFHHLDRCTGPSEKRAPTEPVGSLRFPSSRTVSSSQQPPKRLPTINYSLLKEQDLRKKLRELGIPDFGNRQLLQRRHTEWINLWNANCDSKTPKSKRELLKELDIWERSQGGQASAGSNKVMRKDFDGSAWSAAHMEDYRRLIADARRNRNQAASKAAPQGGASAEEVTSGGVESSNAAEQSEQQPQVLQSHADQPPEISHLETGGCDGDQERKSPSLDESNKKCSQGSTSIDAEKQTVIVEDTAA
ncbi:hypothetical protein VTO42DRAFT_3074 [Malbranchea cinnamomea]